MAEKLCSFYNLGSEEKITLIVLILSLNISCFNALKCDKMARIKVIA